jgi:hypothetical protein
VLGFVLLVATLLVVVRPGSASAAASGPSLHAVLSLSPTSTDVGRSVGASVANSTVPTGDHIAKISLNWGDGSPSVAVATLTTTATHVYKRAGVYTAAGSITDAHGATSSASSMETVTLTPGSYDGSTRPTVDDVHFYVSNDRTELQNITVRQLGLSCSPSGGFTLVNVSVDAVPINSNGTFNTTTTEYGNYPVTYTAVVPVTYKIHFQGQSSGLSAGEPTVTGTIVETATYTNGASYTCASVVAHWSVTRESLQTVEAGSPAAGSYSGAVGGTNNSVRFYVANDQTELQNITIGQLGLYCTPNTGATLVDVSIDAVPLNPDGSFNATSTESGNHVPAHGVVVPATFKIQFQGYFHGLDKNGVPRIAGSVVETMTYTNGATSYCSSGPEAPWYAARDSIQTVQAGRPAAGSYSGAVDGTNDSVSFTVSNDQTELQNVAIGQLALACTPNTGATLTNVTVASVPVNADGSFDATAQETGTYLGHAAMFTIQFRGYSHGLDKNGAARVAGSVLETMTYDDGTTHQCSSGPETPWYVTHM